MLYPFFLEPAILLTTGANVNVTDTHLILTCVAYGEPLPDIEWSALYVNGENVSQITEDTEGFIITNTQIVTKLEGYNIRSLVSILTACDANLTFQSVPAIECTARNGLCVYDAVGYQIARFQIVDNFSIEVFMKEVLISSELQIH